MNVTFAPHVRLGSYELLLELASGGMASVMVARQRGGAEFERLVVVKRVHRKHLGSQDFINMFRDEARLASSVRHANVASVIDVIDADGELCLVMEYFECLSLGGLVEAANAAGEHVAPAVASRIVGDVLAGLHAAHEAVDSRQQRLGIVHRDVSPQNIVVGVDGVTRVIDFGIAKAESRLTHTKSGFVKGKLGYMSPEQIEATALDGRSDLFSAGIVLYETLTGKRLLSSDDEFETMRRVLRGEFERPSNFASHIPRALDEVVRQSLALAATDRFQTGLEFRRALERSVSPASADEVGALVSRLGAPTLAGLRQRLLDVLGRDAERLIPNTERVDCGPLANEAPAFMKFAPHLAEPLLAGVGRLPEEAPAGVPSRLANVRLLLLVLTGLLAMAALLAYVAVLRPPASRPPSSAAPDPTSR